MPRSSKRSSWTCIAARAPLSSAPRISPTSPSTSGRNALIVAGNQKAFAFIDGLITQLDKELPFELRDVRIIPLENADSAAVASSLQRLLDARVTQKAALGRPASGGPASPGDQRTAQQ